MTDCAWLVCIDACAARARARSLALPAVRRLSRSPGLRSGFLCESARAPGLAPESRALRLEQRELVGRAVRELCRPPAAAGCVGPHTESAEPSDNRRHWRLAWEAPAQLRPARDPGPARPAHSGPSCCRWPQCCAFASHCALLPRAWRGRTRSAPRRGCAATPVRGSPRRPACWRRSRSREVPPVWRWGGAGAVDPAPSAARRALPPV